MRTIRCIAIVALALLTATLHAQDKYYGSAALMLVNDLHAKVSKKPM